jgi:[ribosomal protein S18]-alanine N-acetyltransferase
VNLSLQHLTADWLDRVVELDRICLGQLWSAAQYQREFDSPNSDILILIDVDRQSILAFGCVWAIVDEAHITILAVHPDYRHQGFGQLMLWGLLQAAVDRELARATLEVRVDNAAAIQLYEKFGFQVAGRRKKYYDNIDDALILWKGQLQSKTGQIALALIAKSLYQRFQHQNCNLMVSFDTAADTTMAHERSTVSGSQPLREN